MEIGSFLIIFYEVYCNRLQLKSFRHKILLIEQFDKFNKLSLHLEEQDENRESYDNQQLQQSNEYGHEDILEDDERIYEEELAEEEVYEDNDEENIE